MEYKAIKSNGNIAKVMHLNSVIWRGKKPGVPPKLSQALEYTALLYNDRAIYDEDVTVWLSYVKEFAPVVLTNSSYVTLSFVTDNEQVIDRYFNVCGRGKCKIVIMLKMVNPDDAYELNEAKKVFNVTVK